MASVQNIGINGEKTKAKNERTPHSSEMAKEISPAPLGKTPTRESAYWFAHSVHEDVPPGEPQPDPKAGGDTREQQQREKDERVRRVRNLELQEEERLRKVRDLEMQFSQAKRHREQQEEERRRRIEEAKVKEAERRLQVEERKRQIWEAEQERKEAILRRNMEREARIEARRNAQRNSQCFAFGSSTPRSFDLDLAAIGVRNQGSVLMCSVSRRSEERELGPPRATSACSLDRKFGEDCMSRSMVSLSSSTFRGRKRTDILPTMTRERSVTPHTTPRGNHAMRAVSMTRLDQLAQPRRTYRNFDTTPTTNERGPRTVSPSMSKSMCNLANNPAIGRRAPAPIRSASRNSNYGNGNMSRSMLHLPDSAQRDNGQRFTPSPTFPPKAGMRPAKSMLHLSVAAPRLTRAARLRAEALAGNRAVSAWNLSKAENYQSGQNGLSGKDSSRSPSRPHSSLSGTSDISATSSSVSAVNMRPRPAPRRPRPFSVAGSIVDSSILTQSIRKEPERQPRLHDRNASAPAAKPQHAKSANRESSEFKNTKPLIAAKKPVLPPKPTELLAKAKSHPVPIKDNLRKMAKPTNKSTTSEGKPSIDAKANPEINQNGIDKIECKKEDNSEPIQSSPTPAPKPSSTIASPSSDSDKLPTSNGSEASAVVEPDVNTLSQSITEPESKAEDTFVSKSSTDKTVQEEIVGQNIPKEAQLKEDIPPALQSSVVVENGGSKSAVKKKREDTPASMTSSLVMENGGKENTLSKPRITSEEEARAALAEKRRLAREQAEREAELERQRLEEIKRKEEEQRRLEELEQKRMEDEQIRLAELHRQLEQEKLSKAIEEQQQRERDEQEKREEEARQKAEREEQEKKAREEAEKQRIELEEKLRKEEEERAERKRRVEQIMARTRGKSAAQSPSNPQPNENKSITTPSPVEAPKTDLSQANAVSNSKPVSNGVKNHPVNGTSENYVTNSWPFSEEQQTLKSSPLPDLLNSANNSTNHNGSFVGTEEQVSKVSVSSSFTVVSNRTLSANEDVSPQTNGYSSHEEMSCTTSPEENADMGLLIDIQSCQQRSSKVLSESVDFTKLVEVDPPSLDNVVNNENYLINVDDVNSNLFNSANPFMGFEDSIQQKQDTPVTDLLS